MVTGTVILLSSIPFWFLPKSLPKQGKEQSQSKSTEITTVAEQDNFLPEENQEHEEKEKPVTFQELAKGTKQPVASLIQFSIKTNIKTNVHNSKMPNIISREILLSIN